MIKILISALIALGVWHNPVNADIQYECGEVAVVTTQAIRLKNNGYNQDQALTVIIEDAAEPEKAKAIVNKTFSANTNSYKNKSFDDIYKISYKLCLAGIGP
ncbi:hypothetical protein QZJ86_04705 [Methylomonas montana]|uniref:hypothetical protein n=1 Tax=Methylomonas montana TaxID=3058963 RepID=UPI002657BE3F|nr:hypothetical protein [Methylomonas montana]WKJ91437.1 hypothetical protein QZJ86_04705 [Methylomonas montana]